MRYYWEGVCYARRCRRCYLHQAEVEGKEDHEVVQEVYLGESSKSVVSRAREHYRGYKLAMGKTARSTASSSTTTTDREDGSSWMADHAKSHHGGVISIPPIWFGLAFLRTRLPCSDPTTDDKNSRVELVVGT